MQQSRAFHETCERELPKGQASKIPEVDSSLVGAALLYDGPFLFTLFCMNMY